MYSGTCRGRRDDGTKIIVCPDNSTPRSYLPEPGHHRISRVQWYRDNRRTCQAGRRERDSARVSGKDVCNGSDGEILRHRQAADLFAKPPSRGEAARIKKAATPPIEARALWDRD